eukprot:3935702-Rhodomonas_salina.2
MLRGRARGSAVSGVTVGKQSSWVRSRGAAGRHPGHEDESEQCALCVSSKRNFARREPVCSDWLFSSSPPEIRTHCNCLTDPVNVRIRAVSATLKRKARARWTKRPALGSVVYSRRTWETFLGLLLISRTSEEGFESKREGGEWECSVRGGERGRRG